MQNVLRYPVCLIVVAEDYSRFYGTEAGLSTTVLRGRSWAFGLMLQPATGFLLTGEPITDWAGRSADLSAVLGERGMAYTAAVRAAMAADPTDQRGHARGRELSADLLASCLPVDDESRLINEIVAWVAAQTQVLRVEQIVEQFGLSERTLQRLLRKRIGLSPKWLIQRRRLHEAAERLRLEAASGPQPFSLAMIAADLGYADQAHFTRDFKTVTGRTPGQFVDFNRNVHRTQR